MAKVTAPTKGITAIIAGVAFVDSVGETDNERALAYFIDAGYEVEADNSTAKKAPAKKQAEPKVEADNSTPPVEAPEAEAAK